MSKSEVAAEKMLFLFDLVLKYKSRYIKNNHTFNIKEGLSERQVKILISLALSEKNTVSEMAKEMNISKSTLSIILSKLIKKDFVIKEVPEDSDDKRKMYFKITDEGLKQIKQLAHPAVDDLKKIYISFAAQKKNHASEGINKLSVSVSASKNNFYNTIINSKYYKDFENSDEASKLAFKFFIFFMCFAEYYYSILKKEHSGEESENELSKKRFYIMHIIKYLGLNTVSELEEYTNLSGSSISITISRLVKSGFLYKEYPKEGDDGRRVFIRLTEKGLESIEKTKESIFSVLKMYFDGFSDVERENVIEAIEHLIKAFSVNPVCSDL